MTDANAWRYNLRTILGAPSTQEPSMRSSMLALIALAVAPRAGAQTPDTAKILGAARTAVASIRTPDDAARAGFVPVLGNTPLQGAHYARPDLVMRDTFDMNQPTMLMFAPIGDKQTLVGVAYTYYLPTDRSVPRGWVGAADRWHTHDDIARIPGKHIVMMHAWFVESPDGPFAGENSALPYLAADIVRPSVIDVDDHEGAYAARALGMALGLVTAPPDVIDLIHRQANPDLAQRIATERGKLIALIPKLRSAGSSEPAAFDALRVQAIAIGDSLVARYRDAAAGSSRLQTGLEMVIAMYRGGTHPHN
jgi:hypothetical protein